MLSMRPSKTETQKGLVMIASPIYRQKPSTEKVAPSFLKYISQRSLAVAMFVALALLASVGNKPSEKSNSGLTSKLSVSQQQEQTYLSLNPEQLFDNIVRSVKDAFNDPTLIEYAKERGEDTPDSPVASNQSASGKQSAKDFRNKSALNR
jgi:hypothetical protein